MNTILKDNLGVWSDCWYVLCAFWLLFIYSIVKQCWALFERDCSVLLSWIILWVTLFKLFNQKKVWNFCMPMHASQLILLLLVFFFVHITACLCGRFSFVTYFSWSLISSYRLKDNICQCNLMWPQSFGLFLLEYEMFLIPYINILIIRFLNIVVNWWGAVLQIWGRHAIG